MSNNKATRLSGVLLHPTSLPSSYGIGDLGKEAYEFIDFLKKADQHLWQVLPVTPTGFGDSPYQSFSAFAGQPLLISPEHLVQLGLLEEGELSDCPKGEETLVDYGTIIPWKTKILRLAFSRFVCKSDRIEADFLQEYDAFLIEQEFWLKDYALYMACKDMHGGREWLAWEEEYRNCVKMHNITMNNLERKTLVKINQKLKKKKIITQEEYVTLSKIIEERNKINHEFFIVTMKNYEGDDKWEYIKNYLNVVWSIIFEARDIVENIANKNNPNHIHVQTMIDAK